MTVVVLDGVPRDYAWGSTAAIQSMLGRPADGAPMAELWFGDHPDDPAVVASLGTTLDQVIAADPSAALGDPVVARFGSRLPFLLKLLAAERALSIQVHPTLDQARASFAAGDPNYTDANHKPELLCALTPFEALCGFRPVAETVKLLAALDLAGLAPIAALLPGPDGLRAAFTAILEHPEPAPIATAIAERLERLPPGTARAVELAAGDFPGDVGVIVALLLNYVRLAPGEAIYLSAGNVHAYLRGTGVEVMASSDNVLRCGLTPKRIDVAGLLRITDFGEIRDPRWHATGHQPVEFRTPAPDFRLGRLELDAAPVAVDPDGPAIVLPVDDALTLSTPDGDVAVARAHAAFVPAGTGPVEVCGGGRVFVAGCPLS